MYLQMYVDSLNGSLGLLPCIDTLLAALERLPPQYDRLLLHFGKLYDDKQT